MNPAARERRKTEMAFFKDVHARYQATLDDCGDIRQSLSRLKKHLAEAGKSLPPPKWTRLYNALMSGEIIRGKRCTPGDWAECEERLARPQRT